MLYYWHIMSKQLLEKVKKTMGNVDISVIIPVYNREMYISKCLDSILSQKNVSMEIIITDDGSTDSTLDICKKYADLNPNIRVIHQENKGLATSRNNALNTVCGDFVTFIDSDDWITEGAFESMLKAIKENNVDAVIGGFDRVREDGRLMERNAIPDDYKNQIVSEEMFWELNSRKKSNYLFTVVWGKLFRQEIWKELRFGEGIRFAEDEYVLPDLVKECKAFFLLDQIVYNQTYSQGSLSRSEFDGNKLGSPESKLKTCKYLIEKGLHEYAVEKWGIAVGEVILMTKLVNDDETKKKVKALGKEAAKLGKSLAKYMDTKKKCKFLAFYIWYPIFRLIKTGR